MNYFEIQYDKLSFRSAAFLLIRVVQGNFYLWSRAGKSQDTNPNRKGADLRSG